MKAYSLGYLGALTPRSFLNLETLSRLRTDYVLKKIIVDLGLEFGTGILDGATVSTIGSIMQKRQIEFFNNKGKNNLSIFNRLINYSTDFKEGGFLINILKLYCGDSSDELFFGSLDDFKNLPSGVISYSIPHVVRDKYFSLVPLDKDRTTQKSETKIGSTAYGIVHTNNDRYIRRYWEVIKKNLISDSWVPFPKGGGIESFFGDHDFLLHWSDAKNCRKEYKNARIPNPECHFVEGISWPDVGYGGKRFRYLPPGCILSNAEWGFFPKDSKQLWKYLSTLNSEMIEILMLVQTIERHWTISYTGRLPFINFPPKHFQSYSKELHSLKREYNTGKECGYPLHDR